MNPSQASRTAVATSLMRAVHSRADPAPILDDPWGERLLPESVRATIRQGVLDQMDPDTRAKALASPESLLDRILRANAAYADVIIRARYTEDALEAAVARGIDQYVIIGAGFDSFACRRPAYAGNLKVFEVDHPATQDLKRKAVRACNVAESDFLHFVAADLSAEDLKTALARSPFDPTRPTFFSWLGVTMYLTREANLATLRAISSCAPGGSELVFTYVDQVVFGAGYTGTEAFRDLKSSAASAGEAFLSGFDPGALREQLHGVDLQLLEDLNGEQMVARYDQAGKNGLRSNAVAHIAHARVVRA
ncbi:MAG: class I SAM-dependent methyltransferase [Proteobacteria bacterium]|nr:class I SAM-dependent methyltransferase [Pseudomonadota bacterium]